MADAPAIKYDKATFENLIKFIDDTEQLINKKVLTTTANTLDGELGDYIKPGAPDWTPVKHLIEKASAFGGSVNEKFLALSDELAQYKKDLIDAKKVFEDTDDLAKVEASKFLEDHPGLLSSPAVGGGGGTGK
jgi:hypothetical protein